MTPPGRDEPVCGARLPDRRGQARLLFGERDCGGSVVCLHSARLPVHAPHSRGTVEDKNTS